MSYSHVWWYVTRASALIAWALMTLAVVWGILLSTRVMRKVDNPGWLKDMHAYLGGMTFVMVLMHLVSLMLDSWLKFSIADLLVPLNTHFKPLSVALGILALYLLLAVQGSSWMIRKLPRKFWKALHYSNYAVLVLVWFHAALTGTDVGSWWFGGVAAALIAVAVVALVLRIVHGRGAAPSPVLGSSALQVSASPGRSLTSVGSLTTSVVVTRTAPVADGVLGVSLVALGGAALPVWHAGAHITVQLPNGLQRQYSLCGDPAERHRFDIAVLRTTTSEGGSVWMHQNLRPGVTLEVSGPANHFELEPAKDYLFIAGGIGITPITAMIESLSQGRSWSLVYVGRSRSTMAFVELLSARHPGRVSVFARDEQDVRIDIGSLVSDTTAEVYCCGPESLIARVADFVEPERLHVERFVPVVRAGLQPAQAVSVTCLKSAKQFVVPAEQSILEALEEHALPAMGSCRTGVCGTCEVRVVDGIPEHRDSVMQDVQKDGLGVMYPCVSRAVGRELVLDL